jgi:hypothetical protein
MAAPAPSPRGVPAGAKLDDGYRTTITVASTPTISFWERSVKPPGIDGGAPVDISTMLSNTWRVMAPRALRTLTNSTARVAYDPRLYSDIVALINVPTTITIHFPDGSSLAFYGFLQNFEPADLVEGTPPEATLTIAPTNYDPVAKVEAAPVYTAPGAGGAPMAPMMQGNIPTPFNQAGPSGEKSPWQGMPSSGAPEPDERHDVGQAPAGQDQAGQAQSQAGQEVAAAPAG